MTTELPAPPPRPDTTATAPRGLLPVVWGFWQAIAVFAIGDVVIGQVFVATVVLLAMGVGPGESIEGLPQIDGVVDYVSPDFLGVRTSDALYRFIHGLGGSVVLGHHIFANVDQKATERAWQSWVDTAFA